MDVTLTARHTTVPARFRRHLVEKVEKVEQLCPGCHRVDAVVSEEQNPRLQAVAHRVELTAYSRGPVVRAEAGADDLYAALDLAYNKLSERLRRVRDRRKVHHGRRTPESLTSASARWQPLSQDSGGQGEAAAAEAPPAEPTTAAEDEQGAVATSVLRSDSPLEADGSPVTVRVKEHPARPMTLDQALYEMELVGHDFFLFVDADDGRPSVVYRRKGWSYGLIRLAEQEAGRQDRAGEVTRGGQAAAPPVAGAGEPAPSLA